MYIGAWTEYRLAQEQQHSSLKRRQNAGQPAGEFGTCPRGNSSSSSTTTITTFTSSSRRGAAGIYHPSLADKGSTEVAGLPNRESFRRTLASALSSNLAADDAENISQALEPLLQRLPTIHTPHRQRRRISPAAAAAAAAAGTGMGVGATVRRGQQRKTTRHRTSLDRQRGRLRFRHTCSDVGTRSARQWADGTLSTRSGFSVASAPAPVNNRSAVPAVAAAAAGRPDEHSRRVLYLKCCDGHTVGHRRGAGVTGSRVPQLPLILDTRRHSTSVSRNRNSFPASAVAAAVPHAQHRGSTADCIINRGDDDPSDRNNNNNSNNGRPLRDEDLLRSYDNQNSYTPEGVKAGAGAAQNAATTGAVQGSCPGDEAAAIGGGYDRGRAASMLRVARRRDPARIKADFQQFWTWNKRPPAAGPGEGEEHAGVVAASPRTRRDSAKTGTGGVAAVSRKRFSRDNRYSGSSTTSSSSPPSSRLEMLARMKAVYMANIDTAINDSSPRSDSTLLGVGVAGADDAIFPKPPGYPTNNDEEDDANYLLPAAPLFPASESSSPAEAATRLCRGEEVKTMEPQLEGPPPPRDRAPSVIRHEAVAASAHPCTDRSDVDGAGQDIGRASGSRREASIDGGGIYNPSDSNAVSTSSVEDNNQAVVVPDLELTESRIRLVDKYFGGSGGAERRRRRLPVAEEGDDQYRAAHAEDKERGGLRVRAPLDAAEKPTIVEGRGDTSPAVTLRGRSSSNGGGSGNNGDTSDSKPIFARFEEEKANDSVAERQKKQALRADGAVARELLKHHPPSSPPGITDTNRKLDSKCAADGTVIGGTGGKAQGRLPPDISGAYLSEKGCSDWSPTPPASPFARAWCGDTSSLEDLVCWTKRLDFDAAVEGF